MSVKTAFIIGISGALRRQKLCNLLLTDITEGEDFLLVKISNTKNNAPKSLTITGELYYICKKYMQARPQPCTLGRFFFKYSKGTGINQPIGVNKFGSMSKEVAEYLKLPNSNLYTGHGL